MRAGGNDKCNNYLHSKGISKTASIKDKYENDAAALYKEVLKARAEGRPEPTQLVKKAPRAAYISPNSNNNNNNNNNNNSNNNNTSNFSSAPSATSASSASTDPNGLERLHGESDGQYITRQTKLREQAKARMAAKFGNSNGNRTMGGVGSSPHPSQNSSSSAFDMNALSDTLSSGFGTAASGLTSVFSLAKESVGSTSTKGLWSALRSSANDVASTIGADSFIGSGGGGDGLSALNEQMRRERSARGGSSYTGFGSDAPATVAANVNANRTMSAGAGAGVGMNGNSSSHSVTAQDRNGVAPLPGENDKDYMQRQMRIREEAKAQNVPVQPASTQRTPAVTKMKVEDDDDFFSNF